MTEYLDEGGIPWNVSPEEAAMLGLVPTGKAQQAEPDNRSWIGGAAAAVTAAGETANNIIPGVGRLVGLDMPNFREVSSVAVSEASARHASGAPWAPAQEAGVVDAASQLYIDTEKVQADNPWAAFGGKVAGGVGVGLAAAPLAAGSGLMGAVALGAVDGGLGAVGGAIQSDPELAVEGAWTHFGMGAALGGATGGALFGAGALVNKAAKGITSKGLAASEPGRAREFWVGVYKKIYPETFANNPEAEKLLLTATAKEIGELVKGADGVASRFAGLQGKAVVDGVDAMRRAESEAVEEGIRRFREMVASSDAKGVERLMALPQEQRILVGLRTSRPQAADELERLFMLRKDPDMGSALDKFIKSGKDPAYLAGIGRRNAQYDPGVSKDIVMRRPELDAIEDGIKRYGALSLAMGGKGTKTIADASAAWGELSEFSRRVATWSMMARTMRLPGEARAAVFNAQAGFLGSSLSNGGVGVPASAVVGFGGMALDTALSPVKMLRLSATLGRAMDGGVGSMGKVLRGIASGQRAVTGVRGQGAAATVAGISGAPGFVRGKESPHQAMRDRAREIRDMGAEGALMASAVSGSIGVDPEFDQGLLLKQAQVAQYLQEKMFFESEVAGELYGNGEPNESLSPAIVEKFARHWFAAMQPQEVHKLVKTRELTPEHLETLRDLHPATYSALQKSAGEILAEQGNRMDYQTLLQFESIVGSVHAPQSKHMKLQRRIQEAGQKMAQQQQETASSRRKIQQSMNFKPISAAIAQGEATW